MNNVTVYEVDENLTPVPLGASGLIAFSGVCVGRGYINEPERTRECSRTDPHRPGQRLYLGGDYGCWRPDGKLEFLGCRDGQVKIAGFRIEVGEIENALLRVPGVHDCAVVVAQDAERGKRLVAFYGGPGPLAEDTLRAQLAESLPGYMVPPAFHWLTSLPLTGNRKINKGQLAAHAARLAKSAGEPQPAMPGTGTERARRCMGHRARCSGRPDRAVSPREITEYSVLTDLAALIDTRTSPELSASAEPRATSERKHAMSTLFGATALDVRVQACGAPLLMATPAPPNPTSWAAHHRDGLRALVVEHDSVLVRGLRLRDPGQVAAVFVELSGGLMADRESFSARRPFPGGLYSSSKWPANQPMCMHHELSYAAEFPGLMLFACLCAPGAGGATGVADARRVLAALPPELVARFEREGWLLVRNYNDDIGSPLAEAFGTDDRHTVEMYRRMSGIAFEWLPDGGLRTRQRRRAVITHPVTGERCWFNQVAFLNEWTLDPEVREFLVDVYGPDALPFNTCFGDGERIGADVVALINQVYGAHTERATWRDGDLLLVDNIRTAHSREAYAGPREVLVGMANPVRVQDYTPAGAR